jgi:hypothetical protein
VIADRLLRPTLPALWTFLAIALPTLGALIAPMPAVDLAYHLRAGGDILDGAGRPAIDTWTFTIAGTPWTDQQWHAQVLLAAVYRLGGWGGLAILRAVLVAAVFGLLFLAARRGAARLSARTAALLVLVAFLVAAPTLALRPQLLAMVLFAATLLVLADRAAQPRRVWLIPLFVAVWANVHGSFPLAIVLCALAWLAELEDRPRRHTMLGVAIASVAATLLNPFGPGVWGYLVNLATNATIASRVSEWRPPGFTDLPGLLFWVSVWAVVAFVALRARRRRAVRLPALQPWPALLTLAAFAALGAITGRGLAWWPLVAVFVISGLAAEPELPPRDPVARRGSPLNAVVAGVLVLAGVAVLPWWRPPGPAGVPEGLLTYAPQGIAVHLGDVRPGTNVWNPQRWGSWLELADLEFRYAVDSRIELFPASVWSDIDRVEAGTGAWAEVLDRSRVNVVVTDARADVALERALDTSGAWVRSYEDLDGSIWTRAAAGP